MRISAQLLEKASEILQEILLLQNASSEEKYRYLGRILWFLAFARPLQKGSAATSEIFFHALCHKLGLPLSRIKCDISWDIYAMFTTNPDEFSEAFYQKFICHIPEEQYPHNKLSQPAPDNTEVLEYTVSTLLTAYQDFLKKHEKNNYGSVRSSIEFYRENTDCCPFELDIKWALDQQDPYGLGLYHYLNLVSEKTQQINPLAVIIEDPNKLALGTSEKRLGFYTFLFSYWISGQHLFFDGLECKHTNPFILLWDVGYWPAGPLFTSLTEREMLKLGLSTFIKMIQAKQKLDADSLILIKKILIHAKRVYGAYDDKLNRKIEKIYREIDGYLGLSMEELSQKANPLGKIIADLENQKFDFSIDHLMYRTEKDEWSTFYHSQIPFNTWIKRHDSLEWGRVSLFEKALKHHNAESVLSQFIQTISENDMEALLNLIREIDLEKSRLFLFSALFSKFTEDKMARFMVAAKKLFPEEKFHRELMFSLCQVDSFLDEKKVACFFEKFPGDLKTAIEYKDDSEKTPLDYALSRHFLPNTLFVIEHLIKADVNLNAFFAKADEEIYERISQFLCLSEKKELKSKILFQLDNGMLEKAYAFALWWYNHKLSNFHEGLHEAISSYSQKSPKVSFYQAAEDRSSRLKNNVLKVLCNKIKEKRFASPILSALQQNLTFFEESDYQTLMQEALKFNHTQELIEYLKEKTASCSSSKRI